MSEIDREERRKRVEKRIAELKRQKKREKGVKKKFPLGKITPKWPKNKLQLITALVFIIFFIISLIGALVQLALSNPEQNQTEYMLRAKNADSLLSQINSSQNAVVPPRINARAAVLMEAESKQVLYSLNPQQKLPNASTTKILTGIIALERTSLDEKVFISQRAASTGEQSIGMKPGESMTVKDLLYALLVYSANDAAVALAEHVAGSLEGFMEIMNQKAMELGATGTHFANPHGLDEKDHYTTALDLALIGAYAMANAEFRNIVVTDQYSILSPPRTFSNHNKLLKIYPYANGIKTGYTGGAGKCLVGSAKKNGITLISVILNDDNYFNDTAQLLEYGFNAFVKIIYAEAGDQLAEIQVGAYPERRVKAVVRDELSIYVRRDKLINYTGYTISYYAWLPYPVRQDQELGSLKAEVEGVRVEAPLLAEKELRTPNFFVRATSSLFSFWGKLFRFLIPGI